MSSSLSPRTRGNAMKPPLARKGRSFRSVVARRRDLRSEESEARLLCVDRIPHWPLARQVRQVKSEEVDLALHAADDADGFAKVDLGMSRRMLQRHKHLLSPLTPAGDAILQNREAAREAVLVPETLEDPLRRMLLFPRARLVVEENPLATRDRKREVWGKRV